jgi:hypothetical protein
MLATRCVASFFGDGGVVTMLGHFVYGRFVPRYKFVPLYNKEAFGDVVIVFMGDKKLRKIPSSGVPAFASASSSSMPQATMVCPWSRFYENVSDKI